MGMAHERGKSWKAKTTRRNVKEKKESRETAYQSQLNLLVQSWLVGATLPSVGSLVSVSQSLYVLLSREERISSNK